MGLSRYRPRSGVALLASRGGEDMTAAVDSLTRQAAQVESAAGSSAAGGGSTGYAEAGSGELWLVEVKQVMVRY